MKTSTTIGLAVTALVAMIVLAVAARSERDTPQGPATAQGGRVVDCRKPVGRLSTNSGSRCLIRLDNGSNVELWSSQRYEAGYRVEIEVRQREHSGELVYQLGGQ